MLLQLNHPAHSLKLHLLCIIIKLLLLLSFIYYFLQCFWLLHKLLFLVYIEILCLVFRQILVINLLVILISKLQDVVVHFHFGIIIVWLEDLDIF